MVGFLLVSDSRNHPDCLKMLETFGVETQIDGRDYTDPHGLDLQTPAAIPCYNVQTAVVLFRFGRAWT